MKQLHGIRVLLALIFLLASIACIVFGVKVHPMATVAYHSQILLSSLAASAGVSLIWLGITLLFGRFYCAVVCPVGTITDICAAISRTISRKPRHYSYRHPNPHRIHILWIYAICIFLAPPIFIYLTEPWHFTANIVNALRLSPSQSYWTEIGIGGVFGIAAGLISLIILCCVSALFGRRGCTSICPFGIALGYVSDYSLFKLYIDHDACDACGICEEVCSASCVKTVSRYIDNQRCVRCLKCAAKCPREAIRFKMNPGRPATPLFRCVKKSSR